MKRRDILKQMFIGAVSANAAFALPALSNDKIEEKEWQEPEANKFLSNWHLFPNMIWTGNDVWAQRLQDWCIKEGELQCVAHGIDRAVHILTHQLNASATACNAQLSFSFLNNPAIDDNKTDFAGFRLGLKGRFNDYRSAIFTGKGVDAGVTRSGYLFIGKQFDTNRISEEILKQEIRLVLNLMPGSIGKQQATLQAYDSKGKKLAEFATDNFSANDWEGNIAIVSHFKTNKENAEHSTISIKGFGIYGDKLSNKPNQVYGPIYFAQYTVNKNVLKLTAQLAPIDISGAEAQLLILKGKKWTKIASAKIHPLARVATFRVEKWNSKESCPYKITYSIPLKSKKMKEYSYEGIIAADPVEKNQVKALGMSCNWEFGFPDNEVVENALTHNADMIFFLGDQFYEPNGGFGVQMQPLEKACLDYLRKWYMFGWSYRELFRNIPMAALPDDHDMYHGNIWGSGGRPTTPLFGGANSQDSGGYKMLPEWVNMAQLTQTSHMPDPYDPTQVQQHITVYYTSWEYAGISFGIVEDRKFKSAPKTILPEEAKVFNGYAENPSYDHSKEKTLEAQLLGERQMKFLRNWSNQQNNKTAFKVLVSATPFACVQTLPGGTQNDQSTPSLAIPEAGVYVTGDMPTRDMDSNGWPHNRRDEVLQLLKHKVALHLAGDQHLPSIIQYGVEQYGDSCYCFAVPALSNIWPRRWWPTVDEAHMPLPGKPKYTGNFEDGFGNKMTVHAVANPQKRGRMPAVLYDRTTGYGLVEFNKENKKITLHCYPRYEHNEEYEGWPLTIDV